MNILGFEKLLYHREKLAKLENGDPQFAVHATVSLGNFCNHRCLWCTAYEYQLDKSKLMDFDTLVDWFARAHKNGLKAVGYVGNGEPTAYPRFGELVEYAASLGLQQGMFTNGYLLDRVASEVLEHFTYVRISLDAGSAEMHARMHDVPESHYPRIMENLEALISARKDRTPTVGIQYATHHENLSDLHEAARRAAALGVDYFSIKPVFNRGSVGERIVKNRLDADDVAPIVKEIRADFETDTFAVHFRPHQFKSEAANKNTLAYSRCVAGFFNLNVYEDGEIVSCGPHRVSVGNMTDDIKTIEANVMATSKELDLSKCPGGCRYHAMNHLIDSVLSESDADPHHRNFL